MRMRWSFENKKMQKFKIEYYIKKQGPDFDQLINNKLMCCVYVRSLWYTTTDTWENAYEEFIKQCDHISTNPEYIKGYACNNIYTASWPNMLKWELVYQQTEFNPEKHIEHDILWDSMEFEEIKRFDYDLSPDPVFVDVGACVGWWSKTMVDKHGGKSHLFELNPHYIDKLEELEDDRLHVYNYGLHNQNTSFKLSVDQLYEDGFNIYSQQTDGVKVNVRDICDVFKDVKLHTIDVIKINIEGAEYDLLEHMLDNDLHNMCRNLQIQFHPETRVPEFHERRNIIRKRLKQTHKCTYDFYYTWENWKKVEL